MIRLATEKDIPFLVDLLIAFQAEAGCYDHVQPCRDSLAEFCFDVIRGASGDIAIYEKAEPVGAICMLAFPSWYNRNVWVGQEQFWYVLPEFRGSYSAFSRMFKWACKWQDERGLAGVSWSSTGNLNVDKLDNFYQHQGFTRCDVIFRRNLNG
jgi:hypothetical protein